MKNMFKFIIAGACAASIGAVAAVIIKKIVKHKNDVDAECVDEYCENRSRREILSTDFDVPALREEAKALGVKRIWRMKKADLIDAIIAAEDESDDDDYIEITEEDTEE